MAPLADTPVGLEIARIADGESWALCALAGLQYYRYGRYDNDLDLRIIPERGDRLHLEREPENGADANAVRVIWRNNHMLGHLPRGVACRLADDLDEGEPVRAYAWREGDGSSWSLVALLVGRGVKNLHGERLTIAVENGTRDGELRTWGYEDRTSDTYAATENTPGAYRRYQDDKWVRRIRQCVERKHPSDEQRQAAAAWDARQKLAREHREADLIYAFHIARERALMPDGADVAVDDAHRGKTFVWWDQVLAGLVTKTQIKEYGRKPAKDTKPFAHIQYGRGRRERRYDLYSIADAIPIRAAAANAAAVAAEMAYWQRLGHRADENHDYDDEEDERCRVRKDRSRYTEVPVTDYDYDGVPF